MSPSDAAFLEDTYKEAFYAAGNSDPNPAVGALVVDSHGRVLSRGFTHKAGFAHAERHALSLLPERDLSGTTLFVTLEPCCHFGRTPPCTDIILEKKISRVVVAQRDFAAEVAGRSIDLLREKGVSVDLAPEELFYREKFFTTAPFFFARKTMRPRVTLKWAQTSDGKISPQGRASQRISGALTEELTSLMRFAHKLTIASPGTVKFDKARLTVRPFESAHIFSERGLSAAMQIFLERQHRALADFFSKSTEENTIRAPQRHFLLPEWTSEEDDAFRSFQNSLGGLTSFHKFPHRLWELDFSHTFSAALEEIRAQGYNSVFIEAGPSFSEKMLEHNFVDALLVYRSRTNTAESLWGEAGRGNSASLALADGGEKLEGYRVLERAEFPEDDILLFAKES